MPRKLSAIEIAEGALLADIAVIFQLLSLYLPIGKSFLRILVPIVFTIIVLRHRLYVGIMGLCVALFIVGIMTGPHYIITLLLEGVGGLFLGLTMKYHVRHSIILLVGVTGGAFALYSILMLFTLLAGLPLTSLVQPLHVAYAAFLAPISFIASHLGLGSFWQHNVYPIVNLLANLAFTYWWAFWYISFWIFLWPVVIVIYYITNHFARLLGHNVRPFPSGVVYKIQQWLIRMLIKVAHKWGIGRRGMARAIIKEIRRQSIGRYRGHLVPTNYLAMSLPDPLPIKGYLPPRQGSATMDVGDKAIRDIAGIRIGASAGLHEQDQTINISPFIDIRHISYSYPGQRKGKSEAHPAPALQDVSLSVQQGEYLVLLGHNGSGKSTLARHCNALLLPDSGQVQVAGMNTYDEAKSRTIRDMVGMIFQNPDNQIIATVVEDDVAWALAVRGLSTSLIRERVEYAVKAVGISHLRGLPPHRLSGGQRQRLAIAGVLVLRPQCIIADEATAQLDPLSRAEIVTLLHQLNAEYGLTIIQVTHLLEEAALAQRIVVLEQGQIVMQGPPTTIFADLERLRQLKLAIPEPIELVSQLRDTGLPISREALTVEMIAREIVC